MDLEEGEIFDSANSDNDTEKTDTKPGNSVVDGLGVSSTAYRSRNVTADSSSESNSDPEEDSPLWKQKKQKFLRRSKERQMDMRTSPSLPEYTSDRPKDSSQPGSKKKNNIWGSVLDEQTLTQSMAKSADVQNKNYIDFDCRTVESYDYRKKYKDSRPRLEDDESIADNQKPNPTDMFDRDVRGNSGRSIIDYEETVDTFKKKRNRGKKRRSEPEPDHKKGGIFDRLGSKRATTVSIGEIDVAEDMERDELVKKIAEFLHEPKVELIERVVDAMGKEVAIRIVRMTRDVEHAGGMYTFDGSRRRTPGGVFIQLTKQQSEFTSEVKKIVFKEDHERQQEERKEKKKRNKSKKKSKKQNPGDKPNPRSNSNSRSASPTSSKSRSHENLNMSESDSDSRETKIKAGQFDFEAELAAARKQIQEKKEKEPVDEEMQEDGGLDKENISDVNDMQELGEDVVDVLVDDAAID